MTFQGPVAPVIGEGDATVDALRHGPAITALEVGGEAAPVPPSGGEGGESPDGPIPGQEPFPELDNSATIVTPATTDRPESVSEAKPRRRSSGSRVQVQEFVPGHGVLTRQVH